MLKYFLKYLLYSFLFFSIIIGVLICIGSSSTLQLFGETITKINTNEKLVFLTIDDGPTYHTKQILEILNKTDTKATFFLVGEKIKDNSIIEQINNQGHNIGTHSMSHSYLYKNLDYEINQSKNLLENITNSKIKLFRPPYGFKTPQTLNKAKNNDLTTIMWSSFPKDYKTSKEETINTIMHDLSPGMIIVLHDIGKNNLTTLEALPEIITKITTKGYKFALLEDYIK